MPFRDMTGPTGAGSMTGRGRGWGLNPNPSPAVMNGATSPVEGPGFFGRVVGGIKRGLETLGSKEMQIALGDVGASVNAPGTWQQALGAKGAERGRESAFGDVVKGVSEGTSLKDLPIGQLNQKQLASAFKMSEDVANRDINKFKIVMDVIQRGQELGLMDEQQAIQVFEANTGRREAKTLKERVGKIPTPEFERETALQIEQERTERQRGMVTSVRPSATGLTAIMADGSTKPLNITPAAGKSLKETAEATSRIIDDTITLVRQMGFVEQGDALGTGEQALTPEGVLIMNRMINVRLLELGIQTTAFSQNPPSSDVGDAIKSDNKPVSEYKSFMNKPSTSPTRGF